MKPLGVALVLLGIVSLVYGGVSYGSHRTVLDFGSLHATASETRDLPLSPIVGGIAIIGGLLLLITPRPRVALP